MSGVEDLFQRVGEGGWLVIADRLPSLSGDFASMNERIVTHADISFSPFLIHSESEADDSVVPFVDDIEGLLGVKVEVLSLGEAQFAEVAQPGLYVLAGGTATEWITALKTTKLGDALRFALDEGALLIAAGGAAEAMGAWAIVKGMEDVIEGLNWLPGAIVLTWLDDPVTSKRVRSLLALSDPLYAIGIADGRLFAFGPQGEVEMWGVDHPTLALGAGWR
jgi:hypothetical protein